MKTKHRCRCCRSQSLPHKGRRWRAPTRENGGNNVQKIHLHCWWDQAMWWPRVCLLCVRVCVTLCMCLYVRVCVAVVCVFVCVSVSVSICGSLSALVRSAFRRMLQDLTLTTLFRPSFPLPVEITPFCHEADYFLFFLNFCRQSFFLFFFLWKSCPFGRNLAKSHLIYKWIYK